ncbi:MAG TPA: leucyl/phenylalanyl-tRNA--protein transferase [Acidimicrobiia bacterium]|nr:leucyl/phenylalanyl-tRNA--protein transferase [Acidimicrobiia bacterium]
MILATAPTLPAADEAGCQYAPVPIEPAPSRWALPDPARAGRSDVVALGGDLEPGTLLDAYRRGMFPMRLEGELAWWSPDPRGILPLDGFHISRSLRRSIPKFGIRVDTAFEAVMRECGDPRRPHGWIDESFVAAYVRLHEMGWTHSVEAWRGDALVGGVYGVRINGLFAGESMFSRVPDASKVALRAAVELLRTDGAVLFDVQWTTPHLASLGAVDVSRAEYLRLLASAV